VAHLLDGRLHQERAVLGVFVGDAERLEHVLQADAHLAFDAADGLLEHLGERGVGFLDFDRVLELVVVVVHWTPRRENGRAFNR